MALPYDRLKYYLEADDFVKLVDETGDWDYYAVTKDEPMGQQLVQFANAANAVAAGAFSDAQRVPFTFLEPARENRLFQARVTIFAVNRTTGIIADIATVPPLIGVEWGHGVGVARGGTDKLDTITMNTIATNVGGVRGGRMPVNQVYSRDDPNETFDLWCVFGKFPDFRVENLTTLPLGGGGAGTWDLDWYFGILGRKYILRNVTNEEKDKLDNHEIEFRGITLGGIEAVSTKA